MKTVQMYYELVDLESANMIGTFDSEAEALAVVRETIRQHGVTSVDNWAMGRVEDDDGSSIAEGKALAKLALAETPA